MTRSLTESLWRWAWRILSFTLPCAAIWMGVKDLHTAATNRTSTRVTAQQLNDKTPDAAWLEVSAVRLDLQHLCITKGEDKPTEVLIPVLPSGSPIKEGMEALFSAKVLLRTQNPLYLDVAKLSQRTGVSAKKANASALYLQALEKAEAGGHLTLSGLVEKHEDLDRTLRKTAEDNLGNRLSPGFIVLEDGAKPGWWKGLGLIAGGLVWLFFSVRGAWRWFAGLGTKSPGPTQTIPSAPPP